MIASRLIAPLAIVALTGCIGGPAVQTMAPSSAPSVSRYDINPQDKGAIQLRMLDGVNSLRRGAGIAPLQMDAQLNAAAATHSNDMSIQNRPWHFGSDGSSPIDRLRRVGYTGDLTGEVISETFESELQTLAAWMEDSNTRQVILDPDARFMGFDWLQEANGKIWWTMVLAE